MATRASEIAVLGIDPGCEKSAWVLYDPASEKLQDYGHEPNAAVLMQLESVADDPCLLVIENIGHYGTGMPAGREVFDTCLWIGRFIQYWECLANRFEAHKQLILRPTVKTHICGTSRAKDANVAQALRDRFGGRKTKADPDAFFPAAGEGWTDHNYQALALAVYAAEKLLRKGDRAA